MTRAQIALLGALALSALLPALLGGLNPYFVDVAIGVGINITLAVSLNLINGHAGQFSLGHAGFMGVGAYGAAAVSLFAGPALFGAVPAPGTLAAHALFVLALLGGGVAAGVAGWLVGMPSLRLRGDYLALVTLGFGEIIRVVIRNVEPLGGALGLTGIPPYTDLFYVFGFAALTVYVVGSIVGGTHGRGFLAVHDDEVAAEAMGLSAIRYKVTAFVLGSCLAGVAGGLFAHFKLFIEPRGFDFTRSIEIVVMVILGGMGNTLGVIAAAVVLTVLPEVLRSLPIEGVQYYRMIVYSLLLIILMLARPQGLLSFPATRRRAAGASR